MRRHPTARDPIPPQARPIIEAVHRRWLDTPPVDRPRPSDPASMAGLMMMEECATLAQCEYYPIPEEVIRLGCTPDEHLQRQIAEQLPEAVALIMESAT